MASRLWRMVAVAVALSGISLAQSARATGPAAGTDKEKLIGAWHLISMKEPGTGGKLHDVADRTGTLIYTRDGHMSVEIMYPKAEAALTNDYVLNGYEASFGSYDVNEKAHTVTHHVKGSLTRQLVGKDLTRVYRFSEGRLIIQSARPDEHWSVTWEHY